MLVINLKTYQNGTGEKALALTRIIEKVWKETGVDMTAAVQIPDIGRITREVKLPIISQHIDFFDQGSHTGSILPEGVKENGAMGTLLNHAESKLGYVEVKKAVERCRNLGLKTIVCAGNLENAKDVIGMKPDYVAFEYPSLIGTGKSISTEKPEILKEFVSLFKGSQSIPLCGAGISNGEDVKAALNLGTKGVLVASAVVNAENPEKVIREMADAMK